MDYSEIVWAFRQKLFRYGNVHKQKIGDITLDDLCDALESAFEEYDKQKNANGHIGE